MSELVYLIFVLRRLDHQVNQPGVLYKNLGRYQTRDPRTVFPASWCILKSAIVGTLAPQSYLYDLDSIMLCKVRLKIGLKM
jgi:hypothetical protein